MKQFVVAICVPENSSISKKEIIEKIKETFYLDKNDNNESINVVAIDYNSLSKSSEYSESSDLQTSVIGNIDTFIITPETWESEETRKSLMKALAVDNRIINSSNNRTVCTNFFNVSKEPLTEKQKAALRFLIDNYKGTWFSISDFECFKENLKGTSNITNQVKDVIQNTEKSFIEIVDEMFKNFSKSKQNYTIAHVSSVTAIAEQIANSMGYEGEMLDVVKKAAVLHDFGKQFIPNTIINQPRKLNNEEFSLMKAHTSIGAAKLIEVLNSNSSKYLDHIINASAQHHERPDGKGYPLGLKEDEIDPVAKIVSVADAFQAMLGRTYQQPKSLNEIIFELKRCSSPDENGNQQFSKEVADALILILEDKSICEKMGINWKSKDGKIEYKVPSLEELKLDNNGVR